MRWAVAAVILALSTSLAAADPLVSAKLEDARRAKASLKYAAGLALTEQALALGKAGPAEVIAIHRLAGELAAGLGDAATARAHFRTLLALAPDAALPAGTSPKLMQPFDGARADLGGKSLKVRFEAAGDALVVHVDADPATLVAAVRLHLPGGRTLTGAPPRIDVPAETGHAVAAVLDRHGNELVIADVAFERAGATAATQPGARTTVRLRPLLARWWPWAIVTAAFAATATTFSIRARDAQDEHDAIKDTMFTRDFSEAEAIAERGRRDALIANIGWGLTAATGVVTIVLLARGGTVREQARAETVISASPLRGGGMLGFAHQF